jgi:tRNA A-37 threonylcarbamoyl transferase component Bud32
VDVTRFNTNGFVVVWSQVEGGVQHIYGRTSMPRIVNNRFNISEVTELTVTPEMLLADSMWAGPGDLFYTIENAEHVHFFEENNRTNVRETFFQADINNGDIGIRHDGSEDKPRFEFVLSDGDFARTYPAQIYFTNVNNHYPEFINNRVTIIDNEPVVITPNDISATDFDSPDDEIVFLVRNFFSRFERRSNPGMTIPEFVQHEISDGNIRYVPTTNGNNEIPSYEISARDDGGLATEYHPGNVTVINSDTHSDTSGDTTHNGTTPVAPSYQPVIIGVIAGITGCVLIIATGTAISFVAIGMKIKRQKLKQKNQVIKYEDIELTPDSLTARQIKKRLPNRWQISKEQIKIIKKLDQGGGGTIFLAEWNNTEVVYKICALNNEIDVERFKREVILMMEARHDNIAEAFGYCIDPRRTGLIIKYYSRGSLEKLLADESIELSWEARYILICDILRGLVYLHASDIIHRDLKPANILIEEGKDLHARITDFGLSKEFSENQTATTRQMGTFYCMDPCLFKENKKPVYKKKSDMYSTGVILLQIATREEPFKKVKNKAVIPQQIYLGKLSLQAPRNNCPLLFANLMQRCWNLKRRARPSAKEMLNYMETSNVKKAITGYGM